MIANLLPARSAAAVTAALQNDWDEARRLHFALLPLTRALFLETNPIPIKAALSMAGVCRDEVRLPLVPMTSAARDKLRAAMQDSGAL